MNCLTRNYSLTLLGCVLAAGVACSPAGAQGITTATGQVSQATQVTPAPVFNLPDGISKIVSIDAQLVQAQGTSAAPGQVGQPPVLNVSDGISKLVSIDAQNVLLVQLANGEYQLLPVQHVYSGGIARLFGGATIPTEYFVSPALNGNVAAGGVTANAGGAAFGAPNNGNVNSAMGFGVGGFNP
jgi:hypothetical protein